MTVKGVRLKDSIDAGPKYNPHQSYRIAFFTAKDLHLGEFSYGTLKRVTQLGMHNTKG